MTKFSPHDYDAWYETPLGSLCDRQEKEIIFSLFKPEGLVLDMGCGTGNYTLELAKHGVKVIGMDSSIEMIVFAKKRSEKEGLKANFVVGRTEAMPFRDNVFSGVSGITVLCFVSNPEAVIAEAKRILKQGGELVLGEVNSLSYWALLRRIKTLFKKSIYREARFFGLKKLKKNLQKTGFKELKWKSCLYFPPINSRQFLKEYGVFETLGRAIFPRNGAFIAMAGKK